MTDQPMPFAVRSIVLAGLVVPALLGASAAGGEVGEFHIPAVIPLDANGLTRLRRIVASDPEAAGLARGVRAEARRLLDAEPHPLAVIHYEGLVNTDPRRIATVAKLREMGDVARLVRYWQLTGDARAAATLRRFVLAWTSTYRLTGNDVNENKFTPLLVAYHALRKSFQPGDRRRVDAWVAELGARHAKAVDSSRHFTNRYAKHIRLTALCGMILDREEWIDAAVAGIRRFVRESLHPDGTSRDLNRRDTLTYHGSALKPQLQLAKLLGERGRELYAWESPRGGSLKKSVDYVVPYAMGTKTRREWTNSKVGLDHRRAEAGLEKYRPGRLYDPNNALELMEEASYFDPNLARVVRHLTGTEAERFPTWRMLMNAAARAQSAQRPARLPRGTSTDRFDSPAYGLLGARPWRSISRRDPFPNGTASRRTPRGFAPTRRGTRRCSGSPRRGGIWSGCTAPPRGARPGGSTTARAPDRWPRPPHRPTG